MTPTPTEQQLREKIVSLINGRPYYICKRGDEHIDLHSQIGSMTNRYSRHEDRLNEKYFEREIMQLFTTCLAEARIENHDLVVKKFKKLVAGIFAIKWQIDQPYPDDEQWTPYTRFISPRLKALEAAITKGEDIGDLATLVDSRRPTQDKGVIDE